MERIIDATDLIVGRMASCVAKWALLGDKVDIVNCEKAMIVGQKKVIIKQHMFRNELGQIRQGPYFQRMPDRYVRRVIRGMVPRRQEKGRLAYERVMCYIGIPEKLNGKKLETIERANVKKATKAPHMTIKELCRLWGGKQ